MASREYYGIYQGFVSNIKDPEKRGRVKITCPDVLGGNVESAWCDPCVPFAIDNSGDFCLPTIGEAVWVMFIGGDCNQPVYMGGWWSQNKTPLASNYTNLDDTRIISYGPYSIKMSKGKITIEVKNGTKVELQESNVVIKGNTQIEGNVNIKGNVTIDGTISAKNI